MLPLCILLDVRDNHHSYALAGVLSGIYVAGMAVGGPFLGRALDRLGQSKTLALTTLVCGFSVVALGVFTSSSPLVLVIVCALSGLITPPVEPAVRTQWPSLVAAGDLQRAHHVLTVAQEAAFLSGPALVTAVTATTSARGATFVAGALVICGGLGLAAQSSTRRFTSTPAPIRSTRSARRPSLTSSRSTNLLILLLLGAPLGVLSVAATSVAEGHGQPQLAGLVLATEGIGALIGGLLTFLVKTPRNPRKTLLLCIAFMAVMFTGLVAVTPSVPLMLLFAALSATPRPLALTTVFLMVGDGSGATPGEAFGWAIATLIAGGAISSALGGFLVDHGGTQASLAIGSAALLAALAVSASAMRRVPRSPAALAGIPPSSDLPGCGTGLRDRAGDRQG
jgi:predicted MFS family arabinose efflux permease